MKKAQTALILAFALAGCNSQKQPAYEDGQGLRIMPPQGWVERARDDAIPAKLGHRQQSLPLPPRGAAGSPKERFLVRYDRPTAGHHAWLRVTVADLPTSTSLLECLSTCAPGRDWTRQGEEENLEMSGLPAARIVFVGRWQDQDYLCETVAVRKGEKVYLFSTALPAADDTGREQARQAIRGASWGQ